MVKIGQRGQKWSKMVKYEQKVKILVHVVYECLLASFGGEKMEKRFILKTLRKWVKCAFLSREGCVILTKFLALFSD